MRTTRLTVQLAAVAVLLFGAACHKMEVTHETFVSQNDPTQILKLESNPSLKVAVFGKFHNFDAAGNFEMGTAAGTIRGSYTYAYNSKGERGYVFHPEKGDRWEATLTTDGTFTDGGGLKWRIQHVKYERAPLVLEEHLAKVSE